MTFNEGKLSELISILRSYMYPKLGILSSITETKVKVVLVVETARVVSVVMVVLFVVLASIPQTALSLFTYTYMKFLSFLTQGLSFCSTNVVKV